MKTPNFPANRYRLLRTNFTDTPLVIDIEATAEDIQSAAHQPPSSQPASQPAAELKLWELACLR